MKGINVVKRPLADSCMEISLDDVVLEHVAGGFVETEGYANKKLIICPYCGNKRESSFEWWEEKNYSQNGYTCNVCNKDFWVDGSGQYYDIFDSAISFDPIKRK